MPPHLRTLEEVERDCIPGLVGVLQTEGVEGVRYALWDMTGWHRDYDPCVWRNRASEEQKRAGWEIWVRMDKKKCLYVQHNGYNYINGNVHSEWISCTAPVEAVNPSKEVRKMATSHEVRSDQTRIPYKEYSGYKVSEEPRQPRQDEQQVSSMKEVAVTLTHLEEPRQPRQDGPRVRAEDGPRVRAVKEVAVSMTIGVSAGLALAWGYGLPGAL